MRYSQVFILFSIFQCHGRSQVAIERQAHGGRRSIAGYLQDQQRDPEKQRERSLFFLTYQVDTSDQENDHPGQLNVGRLFGIFVFGGDLYT